MARGPQSITSFVGQLRIALDFIEALGVARRRQARFEKYLALLAAAEKIVVSGGVIRWRDQAQKESFLEAASQSLQLVGAVDVLAGVDDATARARLALVVDGPEMPPYDPSSLDRSRDILLELAAANVLRSEGFVLRVPPIEAEDIEATVSGFGSFVVECKRPAHWASLGRNLVKARKQIQGRNRDGRRFGLVVIGVDRMLGDRLVLSSREELPSRLHELHYVFRRHAFEAQTAQFTLFPSIPLLGSLITTAAQSEADGELHLVADMMLSPTGPEDHPVTVGLRGALSAIVDVVSM